MKNNLILNIDKLHTTDMGIKRIQRNLNIHEDVLDYCKKKIINKNCLIKHIGKNYYCEIDNIIITVNATSYTIITAHIK